MARTVSSQLLKVGENAPEFRLKGVDNILYSLRDFKSKTVLVVFICNHCPYVKARIKDIVSLQQTFRSEELQVVGINSNDPNYDGEGFDNMEEAIRGCLDQVAVGEITDEDAAHHLKMTEVTLLGWADRLLGRVPPYLRL